MNTEKNIAIKNSIISGLIFGLVFGIFEALIFGIVYAAIAAPIAGLLFGLCLYFFVTSKKVKSQTELIGENQNSIIYSGAANHFKHAEAVGGKLYLLKDRLEFKSHGFNIQNHAFKIDINEIKELVFYKSLGIVPNGLQIVLKNAEVEKFVLNNRNIWKKEIEKLMALA